MMCKMLTMIVFVSSICFSSAVQSLSDVYDYPMPYLGVGVDYALFGFEQGYGAEAFSNNLFGGHLHAGVYLNKYLGFEGGLEYFLTNKKENHTIPQDSRAFGRETRYAIHLSSSKYNLMAVYFDCLGTLPVYRDSTRLFMGIGVGYAVFKSDTKGSFQNDENQGLEYHPQYTIKIPHLRLKIGLEQFLGEHVSLKIYSIYKTTKKTSANVKFPEQQVRVKNSLGLGGGLAYRF